MIVWHLPCESRTLPGIFFRDDFGYSLFALSIPFARAFFRLKFNAYKEILALILHLVVYIGFPAAINALNTAKETFDEMGI